MQDQMKVNEKSELQVFDIIALPIFVLLIVTAFATFQYPSNQPNLYFWGGTSLLSSEYYPLAVIFLITIPALFIVAYFIPYKRNTWRLFCCIFMATLVLTALTLGFNAAVDGIFNFFIGDIFVIGFCASIDFTLTIVTGDSGRYNFQNCLAGQNGGVTIELGAALAMFCFAVFLSVIALLVRLVTRSSHIA